MASAVKLYVYDVSQGMARSMSQMLLGKYIEGVWHTAILAYGSEYFFGSGGIAFCPPSGTILGHPTEVIDLGPTEIPRDMFHEYLRELETDRFRGDKYHLLKHNCNTFSKEVAEFLTGNSIPDKITNLPAEVMSTPLGQMMMPFIDNMMQEMNRGMHLGSSSPSQNPSAAAAAPSNNSSQPSAASSTSKPSAGQTATAKPNVPKANPASDGKTRSGSSSPKPTSQSRGKGGQDGHDDLD